MVFDGSIVAAAHSLSSDKMDEARTESSELFDSFLASDVAETELLGSNKVEEARHGSACTSSESSSSFLVSGVAETERLGSVEPEEARFGSACTIVHGKNLERDPDCFSRNIPAILSRNGGTRSSGFLNYTMGEGLRFRWR